VSSRHTSVEAPKLETSKIARSLNYRLIVDPLWGQAKAIEALLQRQRARQTQQSEAERAQQAVRLVDQAGEAVRDPYIWATEYTETYNPHWVEEGRTAPYEKFPSREEYPHLSDLFELLGAERIHFFEKSRDVMLTWGCVAFLTNKAMVVPAREVLFQTQKVDKVKQLIKYARCLYDRQPQWLRDAFPLAKNQSDLRLNFAHGGSVIGIPGGADQVRSYHPWGYMLDEASFVPDAGECFNEALSAVAGSIIFNSSAGPGWFADVRRDVILNVQE
jgi:hypothetical protein